MNDPSGMPRPPSGRAALTLLLLDVSHDFTRAPVDSGYTMLHPPVPLLALAS